MRNVSGFTLIELMITIAVFSILAAVAIPNFIGWLPKRQLQSSAVDVQVAVNLSKMTAIRENTDVVLTFDPVNNSYEAFVDNNEDGDQDAGEPTIRNKKMSSGINLHSTTIIDPDEGADVLIFNGRGLTKKNVSGDIKLRNRRGEERNINVTVTGMSRIN